MTNQSNSRRRAAYLVEAAVSMGILGVIAGLTVSATLSYAKVQTHYHRRLAVLWAAEAHMERILAGAATNSSPPTGMIDERITLKTRSEPGSHQWTDFDLITVTATWEQKHSQPIVENVRCFRLRRGEQ